jgi:NAD(P)-dependent dehydrogenase (short-subunit alcohol dehydrogenase family)
MTVNPMSLEGKKILVTGASSGIGRATSQLISRLGGTVILLARDEKRLKETSASLEGEGHAFYVFDLMAVDDIPAWLKKITKEQGPINGFFHAAGTITIGVCSITKEKHIDKIFGSSIKAALMLTKGFCQQGVKAPGMASLVYMSSVTGQHGVSGLSLYAASKGAIDSAMKSLAVELASRGIRVNSIVAAKVEAEMNYEHIHVFENISFKFNEEKHLLGVGSLEDVANAAVFLLSDAAKWITGTTMIVDGGYSCS